MTSANTEPLGGKLSQCLLERRVDIEQGLLARVYSVAAPHQAEDPEYVAGLSSATSAALSFALAALETRRPAATVPARLTDQARRAARSGVSLDTVLRRYFAGYTLLSDYVLQEATTRDGVERAALREVLRGQASAFDRVVRAVTEAYVEESEIPYRSASRRRAESVKRILDGELLDPAELDYPLEGWHLGIVAAGQGAGGALRECASVLRCSLLLVHPGGEQAWAWLGGREPIADNDLAILALRLKRTEASFSLGEPGRGVTGWRLSHREARAGLAVLGAERPRVVRYADVALIASAIRDPVLAASLQNTYLVPLGEERDGGAALKDTLRTYFATGRNAASAAAALRLSRQTVHRRLHLAEQIIGRSLTVCASELETALHLNDLDHS